MTQAANIMQQKGCLIISGDLNFFSVMSLWQQSLTLFSSMRELRFDLAEVSSSNSAGVALVLEWIKYARAKQKPIQFTNVPNQLASVLKAAGVDWNKEIL